MNTTNWHNFTLQFTGKTDLGRKRSVNEDNYLLYPEVPLYCIADGAGGHTAGRKASEIAVSALKSFFQSAILPLDKDATPPIGLVFDRKSKNPLMVQAIEYANKKVYANITSKSMATTMVACHFLNHTIMIAHVGDSRAYLLRNDQLTMLTDDHSLVFELFKMGKINADELKTHPRRNVITRAIGPTENVKVSCDTLSPMANDLILLCSDGLTSMIDDQTIEHLCSKEENLDRLADNLIRHANDAGGKDNITVALIKLKDI